MKTLLISSTLMLMWHIGKKVITGTTETYRELLITNFFPINLMIPIALLSVIVIGTLQIRFNKYKIMELNKEIISNEERRGDEIEQDKN